MSSPRQIADDSSLPEIVYEVVKSDIGDGHLRAGMALGESSLASQFGISRIPVGRALRELERDGFVVRAPGRGFLVAGDAGGWSGDAPPLRISEQIREVTVGRASWSKLYQQVEHDLVSCMPFGRFKIVELAMAEYFGVSRTITRDLIGRLEERGMIEREGRSKCFLPELDRQMMMDLYEVRRLLEPAALLNAAPFVSDDLLTECLGRLDGATARFPNISNEELDELEDDLHIKLLVPATNLRLIRALRTSQLPLLATNYLFKRYVGVSDAGSSIAEHRVVFELLALKSFASAAAALDAHLTSALQANLRRLEEVKANHQPEVPPYLALVRGRTGQPGIA
jgi:DNA-binding GntR family transcriptional regulator